MANLKDIRLRIGSVKSTQQITRAMKMVSAAKLRKAQHNIVSLRPYAKKLLEVIADIALSKHIHHPLLSSSVDSKKELLVVLSSDRGLCGGFNSNINKFAHKIYLEKANVSDKVDLILIGRKSFDYFKARKVNCKEAVFNLAKEVSYDYAAKIAQRLMEDFSEGGYDSVKFIYNEFKSAIAQEIVCEQIFPIDLSRTSFSETGNNSRFSEELIFEPQPEFMLDGLLKQHFAIQVYRCLSESVAAEHGARMSAMENATKNAAEMIRSLTLTYNKLRQASITTELIEITSGAEALKG
ncbi:MAG: ATP synthase F1 subunit gamma [Bdellovibrionales bacterium]|nr:ATP synthase F1 subunit gamma [Bdellovibrionales bacterium]